MPDISKINALGIGSVGKVDGLAKASILDIDGVAVPAAVAPPLDTYTGAVAAYSVRLLRTAYTGDIMRVRRASDNVEADVGFDGGELKLTSPISNTSDAQSYTDFADFVDHTGTPTDAFVRYWYDQSNANDAGQSTASEQPQIYDATTGLLTENSKPAIQFTVPNNTALDMGTLPSFGSNYLGVSVSATNTTSGTQVIYYTATDYSTFGVTAFYATGKPAVSSGLTGSSGGKIAASSTANSQILHTGQLSSGTLKLFVDGTEETATTGWVPFTGNFIGRRSDGFFDLSGTLQEIILWNSDESSNRTGIETNINGFFSIYP